MKILGKITEERETIFRLLKREDYISICKGCGTIFKFEQSEVIQKGTAHIRCPLCNNEYQIPRKYIKAKPTTGCSCASRTDEYNGWRCSITDGACMFLYPNAKACAEVYGEGPEVNSKPALYTVVEELFNKYLNKKLSIIINDTTILFELQKELIEIVNKYNEFKDIRFLAFVESILRYAMQILEDTEISFKKYIVDIDLSKIDNLDDFAFDLGFKYHMVDEQDTEDESFYGSYMVEFEDHSNIKLIMDELKRKYNETYEKLKVEEESKYDEVFEKLKVEEE